MNLIFDIGNTYTKVAIFKEGREIFNNNYIEFTEKELNEILSEHHSIQQVIISKVKEIPVIVSIKNRFPSAIELNENTPIPLTINYETPETLGYDRIAACTGANAMYPEDNILVIDAGTAITFDFITNKGVFEGGNISPGLRTRLKALNYFTGKLPLISPDEAHTLTGKSTAQAISGGVWFGMIYEIQGYINEYVNRFGQIKIILTGGDAPEIMGNLKKIVYYNREGNYFAEILKNSIFVVFNLSLTGLNRILEYNVNKK